MVAAQEISRWAIDAYLLTVPFDLDCDPLVFLGLVNCLAILFHAGA